MLDKRDADKAGIGEDDAELGDRIFLPIGDMGHEGADGKDRNAQHSAEASIHEMRSIEGLDE